MILNIKKTANSNKNCYVLGIHDGHNCGAAISLNGKIVASVSEERLTRNKNEIGYPKKSISECLKLAGIDSSNLSDVVLASNFMHEPSFLKDITPWYVIGEVDQNRDKLASKDYEKIVFLRRKEERISLVTKHLGVKRELISFMEHHLAHLAAAYYTAPNVKKNKSILGLTCDGAGDGLSATVSICKNNSINRISITDRHASLGKIYSRITLLLGMKPWEHEYKIMGLAPYADKEIAIYEARKLHKILKLSRDGLGFQLGTHLSTNYSYYYLKDVFERVRFDNIAGAVQKFTEDMLIKWVKSIIKKTKIRDLVCGGGVFMNVKANMLIQNLPEVRSIYVMPSASDESLAIGAALYFYYNKKKIFNDENGRLQNLYLGSGISDNEVKRIVRRANKTNKYSITEVSNSDQILGKMLNDGEIISVCRGRAEWGARALGNRSIIAKSGSRKIVEKINAQIKMRDFWMPFAPTILDEKLKLCVDDKNNLEPDFMTFALPTKNRAYDSLAGAMHPVDKTCRPQVLKEKTNPKLYKMLNSYCDKYEQYGVLQTSFNIHGEPIVNNAEDAFSTLNRSGLRHLLLENFLISKN